VKHLFIVNPKAFYLKGRVNDVCNDIRLFFAEYPQLEYEIHVTRWKRDAVGFTRRYVSAADRIVRVYAAGGMGTLMEIINGVVGLPNVQVAVWPFGIDNAFLCYFGKDRIERFRSLRNLIFSGVSSFDLIRCGNNFGICAGFMGVEALAARNGDRILGAADLIPGWLARSGGIYLALAIYYGIKKEISQSYQVVIDGTLLRGDYNSILVANQPYLGGGLQPAVEARPDDGLLDVYLVRSVGGLKLAALALDYSQGRYYKWPRYISHYRGKTIAVSSDQIMEICLDGEHFYDTVVEYQAVPQGLDFVCPGSREDQGKQLKEA
jgi:diacylglycerol kinase family enzyme